MQDYKEQGLIIETDKKIKALEDFIKVSKKSIDRDRKTLLTVSRGYIVESTCTTMMQVPADELHRSLSVNFLGEPGVDAGGLTMELFHAFFSALFPPSLEEADGQLFVTSGSGGQNETPTFLPATMKEASFGSGGGGGGEEREIAKHKLMLYEGVGRMMAKAIFEGISVACPLCPSVFKFFLDLVRESERRGKEKTKKKKERRGEERGWGGGKRSRRLFGRCTSSGPHSSCPPFSLCLFIGPDDERPGVV